MDNGSGQTATARTAKIRVPKVNLARVELVFHPDQPDCPVEVVGQPRASDLEIVVSNSFGFGGQNAALVLAHPDSDRG